MRIPRKVSSTFIHLILWLGYSMLLFYGPSVMMDNKAAMLFSVRTLSVQVVVFYLNSYVLLPRLLGKSKYMQYVMSLVVVLALSTLFYYSTDDIIGMERHRGFLMREMTEGFRPPEGDSPVNRQKPQEETVDEGMFMPLSMPDSMRMRHAGPPGKDPRPFFSIPPFIRAGTLSSLGILFISILFWVIGESRKQRDQELRLVNQNLRNEMKFLKSQINPHFLFNALNNIYSLSILHSVKTPDMILKLSAMLRYVLYDSEGRRVPLAREVSYIRNFIDFQRVKIEGIPNLHVDIDRADGQMMIEPMLLIPFVENAFKYSKIENTEKGWIKMVLTTEKNKLRFEIRNSLLVKNMQGDLGGIGVENTRQRLKMLYPDRHELYVGAKENEFMVLLKIEVNEA